MTGANPTRYRDFLAFCRLQLASHDYDAHIPLLVTLRDSHDLDAEETAWLALLYMAYYSEGSMWAAFTSPGVRSRTALPPAGLPITTQRRNLYGGRIVQHLQDLHAIPGLAAWLLPARSWPDLLARVGQVWGNGRWAAYTTSELLGVLLHLRAAAPTTYEIAASTGPRRGMLAIGLSPSEADCSRLHRSLEAEGVCCTVSQLESLLCDFGGMCRGRFYPGRNIDRQQGRILTVQAHTGQTYPALWRARLTTYPAATLGERGGWAGINPGRLKHYASTGRLLAPQEGR